MNLCASYLQNWTFRAPNFRPNRFWRTCAHYFFQFEWSNEPIQMIQKWIPIQYNISIGDIRGHWIVWVSRRPRSSRESWTCSNVAQFDSPAPFWVSYNSPMAEDTNIIRSDFWSCDKYRFILIHANLTFVYTDLCGLLRTIIH